MEQKRELLQQEIAATSQSLRSKIEKLEETTLETVESVADGVKQTAETIAHGIETLSIERQVQKRPITMVALSLGVGLLAGRKFARRNEPATTPPHGILRSVFSTLVTETANAIVPLAVNTGAGILSEWAKKKFEEPQDSQQTPKHPSNRVL